MMREQRAHFFWCPAFFLFSLPGDGAVRGPACSHTRSPLRMRATPSTRRGGVSDSLGGGAPVRRRQRRAAAAPTRPVRARGAGAEADAPVAADCGSLAQAPVRVCVCVEWRPRERVARAHTAAFSHAWGSIFFSRRARALTAPLPLAPLFFFPSQFLEEVGPTGGITAYPLRGLAAAPPPPPTTTEPAPPAPTPRTSEAGANRRGSGASGACEPGGGVPALRPGPPLRPVRK